MNLCICGHAFDLHNDITKRCCFRVMLGWDRTIDLPAMRTCNLCPPSGFQQAVASASFANAWPKEHRINRDELRGIYGTEGA
jgi:hypothetical protein